MTINTTAITTPEAASQAQVQADWKRAFANRKDARGDWAGARWERLEAADLDAKASHVLDPSNSVTTPLEVGRGGELIIETAEVLTFKKQRLRDTVKDSLDMLTARASESRLELALEAGVLSMAADAVDTINSENSLERMLATQLAALHMLAMKNAATAASFAATAANQHGGIHMHQRQIANVEATRSTNAAARASEAYQRGMLTLDRLRNGGRQNVVVQHVNVGHRGQAVVAGAMQSGGTGER